MFLTRKNLSIRNAVPADAILLSAWWNDGTIMAHAGYQRGTGQTPDMIADDLRKDRDMVHRRLIIEEEAPGTPQRIPIGEMNYRNVSRGTAEIGIKICNTSRQDMGYGQILLSMLIEELFMTLHFTTVIADTNQKNLRSQHVLELLGFQRVGVREQALRDSRGVWQTAIHYQLTPEAFRSVL